MALGSAAVERGVIFFFLFFKGLIPGPFFSSIVLSKNRIRFPWVSGGFLEGSLERMESESLSDSPGRFCFDLPGIEDGKPVAWKKTGAI